MVSVLLLFTIGIVLIVLNFRAIKKEKKSFNNVLVSSEQNMKDYEVELGKLRREFSETILELQRDIEDLKDEVHKNNLQDESKNELSEISSNIKNKIKLNEKIGLNLDIKDEEVEHISEYINKESENKTFNSNSIKINEMHEMIKNGMSIDEIAEKTGMGKGELLLIKELYKN